MSKRFKQVAAAALLTCSSVFAGLLSSGVAAAATTRYVSTSGTDSGNCSSTPCKTVNYALSQASPGDTIQVAAGTYNQTIDVEKPITLVGAGQGKTIIDGKGLDTTGTDYGVIHVGTISPGGTVNIYDFTFTDPYPYTYTGGEPEAVALADATSTDHVNFFLNGVTEGTADPNSGTDFPIGIDTFKNAANTIVQYNSLSGFFQGALLEDNGPVSFTQNYLSGMIANSDTTTSPPTAYSAEGVFFLSDLSGSITGQSATSNVFTGYSGLGVIMEAGYNNGNCSTTPCNGSISGTVNGNSFALGAASDSQGPASAIALTSKYAGNMLTATVANDTGYVTSPDTAISAQAESGGSMSLNESNDPITVKSSSSSSASAATISGKNADIRDNGLRIR